MSRTRVFVTGCFDMLHSGHVAFLKEAAEYGDVYVGIGSDETVGRLKGRYPINNQDERKFMLEALRCITRCTINKGSGIMDFVEKEQLAKTLFAYENPPGTEIISGSQDALGIVLPGLNRLEYNASYWPHTIKTVLCRVL